MSPLIVTVTREDLIARQEAVLAKLGMSLAEFKSLAAAGTLIGEEWDALEELDEIEFLLGD